MPNIPSADLALSREFPLIMRLDMRPSRRRWFSPWQIVLYWGWRQSIHSIWSHLPGDIGEDQRETPWAHHESYPFILPWHPNPDRENTYPGTRKSPWPTGSTKNRTATTNNLNLNTFAPMGSTMIKAQNGSFKESDSAWKNANIRSREGDFPCLVVQAGLSLSRLRSDASWWMEGSDGKVNIFLIIWICNDGSLYPTQRSPQSIYPFLWNIQLVSYLRALKKSTENLGPTPSQNSITKAAHPTEQRHDEMGLGWSVPWKTKRDEATNEPFVLGSRPLLPLSSKFPNALPNYERFSC